MGRFVQSMAVTAAFLSGGVGGGWLVSSLGDGAEERAAGARQPSGAESALRSQATEHDSPAHGAAQQFGPTPGVVASEHGAPGDAITPRDIQEATQDFDEASGRSAGELLAEFEAAYRALRESVLTEETGADAQSEGAEAAAPSDDAVRSTTAVRSATAAPEAVAWADGGSQQHRGSQQHPSAEPEPTTVVQVDQSQHTTQQIVQNTTIAPVSVVVAGDDASRSAGGATAPQPTQQGRPTVNGYFSSPFGNGSLAGGTIGWTSGQFAVPGGSNGSSSGRLRTWGNSSAHGSSPWDSTDYSQHHNPWETRRIP